jgi:hypothetical protein
MVAAHVDQLGGAESDQPPTAVTESVYDKDRHK